MPAPTPFFHEVCAKHLPEWRVVEVTPLQGGTSEEMSKLIVRRGNDERRLVCRRYGKWSLGHNPKIAQLEFELRNALHEQLPVVPPVFAFDPGDASGQCSYLLEDFLEGESGALVPIDPKQLAGFLAELHSLKISLSFSPVPYASEVNYRMEGQSGELDVGLQEPRLESLMAQMWPFRSLNQEVLLHSDFWPGNTLWRDHQLKAVIDWGDGALGDPLEDVANMRMEMLWIHGKETMEQFTEEYFRLAPQVDRRTLGCWDIWHLFRATRCRFSWGFTSDQHREMEALSAVHLDEAESACREAGFLTNGSRDLP